MSDHAPFLRSAQWETVERGLVELTCDWPHAGHPPLFLDPGQRPLRNLRALSPYYWGRRSGYCRHGEELVFILWPSHFPSLDWTDEPVYLAGDFNNWGEAMGRDEWRLRHERLDGKDCLVLRLGADHWLHGRAGFFKFVTGRNEWLEIPSDAPNGATNPEGAHNFALDPNRTGHHLFHFWPETAHTLLGRERLVWDDGHGGRQDIAIDYGDLLLSLGSDLSLGARVEAGKTVFRLFAPRAEKVTVVLYRKRDASDAVTRLMHPADSVVWEYVHQENLHGCYYHYHVSGENRDNFSHFDSNFRILDPYALAVTGREGPAIVYDADRLPWRKSCFVPPHWHDLVIVEAHVRDLIARAPIDLKPEERRGFKGLTRWLRDEGCYLRQLGVNAVELQPIQENDAHHVDEYHWGYMTVNYFSPASQYATDPWGGSQVEEFAEMVEAFHDADLAVILDVVYNHVGEPNTLQFIDKYYYLETDQAGTLTNWSGCGNDLRCDTPMGLRLIIDSLVHLVETYDVDGFRFDLAELIGVEPLRAIEKALKAVKPSIILIAEPWSFRGHIAHILRRTGFASWNDGYRDFIPQYLRGEGNQDGMRYFITGSPRYLASWPAQTVNYVESHDDFCWMDRITENADNRGDHPTANDVRRTHLMVATLMSSIGIPMLSAGQDMLRSKQGIHNTYQRGDINALNYDLLNVHQHTARYFRGWIRFRLSPQGSLLRLKDPAPEHFFRFYGVPDTSAMAVLYNASGHHGHDRLLFAINPHNHPVTFVLEGLLPGGFVAIADENRVNQDGLDKPRLWDNQGKLEMPPMSCGLWLREPPETPSLKLTEARNNSNLKTFLDNFYKWSCQKAGAWFAFTSLPESPARTQPFQST
jgi:pullulanase